MKFKQRVRVKELVKSNGMTMVGLARRLGVSYDALKKWNRAGASPSDANVTALRKIFNCTPNELYEFY